MLGDCHIHMVLDGVDYRRALARHRPKAQDEWIRDRLSEYARAGVWFLRDGGDALGAAKRARGDRTGAPRGSKGGPALMGRGGGRGRRRSPGCGRKRPFGPQRIKSRIAPWKRSRCRR